MERQADNSIRFSLLSLLGVCTYVSLTLALASSMNSIPLGIHLSLGLVGWVLWRYAHGHLGGIIPVLLGGDALLCASVPWVFHASEDFLAFRAIFCILASLLVLVGFWVFIWIGSKDQPYSKHQHWIAGLVFCILGIWWVAIPALGEAAIARRQAADIAANNVATARAIELVEEARQRIGTIPDEDTLPQSMKEPMPSIRWDGHTYPIRYWRKDDTSYELSYIDPTQFLWGDIVTYDSDTAQRGWYRIPF